MAEEEYEVVPVTPIKHLEKRLKKLEEEREMVSLRGFVHEVMDLVKSNQGLIDEIVRADNRLRDELSRIPTKIDELLAEWKDFISLLREIGKAPAGVSTDVAGRLDRLIEQNEEMIENQREILKAIGTIKRKPSISVVPTKVYPKIRIKKKV
jgi:uncharacterized protein YeeX (DUF496 family)